MIRKVNNFENTEIMLEIKGSAVSCQEQEMWECG